MKRLVLSVFLSVSLLATAVGQSRQPQGKVRYAVSIEMPRGYVSGLCVLLYEDSVVTGSIFNEFGITALEFIYHPGKQRVRLLRVMDVLDKWYIRKVLKRDLARLLKQLQAGEYRYENRRRHIVYRLMPMNDV